MPDPRGGDSRVQNYQAAGAPSGSAGVQGADIYGLGDLSGYNVFTGTQTYVPAPGVEMDWGPPTAADQVTDNVYASADNLMQQFMGTYGTDQYDQVRGLLYGSGAYGSMTYANFLKSDPGDDAKALVGAMKGYRAVQQAGVAMTFAEYLSSRYAKGTASGDSSGGSSGGGGGGGGGGGSMRAPLQISYTDPAALKNYFNKAMQDATGRAATEDEANSFVDSFHAQEASSQSAAYGGAGEVTMPNASAQAVEQAKTQSPTEYNEYQTMLLKGLWDSIAGKSGGSA